MFEKYQEYLDKSVEKAHNRIKKVGFRYFFTCHNLNARGIYFMEISYNKLWKRMIDLHINKTQLKYIAGISTNAVAKLGKNEAVSMESLDKICRALNCNVGDIMEFVSDEIQKNNDKGNMYKQMELTLTDDSISVSNKLETEKLLSGAKAMKILDLSRHNFEKTIKEGLITPVKYGKKQGYRLSELNEFMKTDKYNELLNGTVDPRNSLNDLTGKDWLPETKSFFYQKGLGANHPEAQIEKLHPAPYSFQDIGHLIKFFTKSGMRVLDPFGGVGSTAKACEVNGRFCTSIELSKVWHDLSIKRLETEVGEGTSKKHQFINGDSCIELPKIPSESIDFVVTSPPYWGILNKQDQKVKKNRVANNLETKYSESKNDLGNVDDYEEFLNILVNKIFLQCARTLKYGKYMAIVVSDFRDKSDYISFHSDLIQKLNKADIPDGGIIKLQGIKILLQNHKSLLPYGYPFAYVENIHHQYILIFRKEKQRKKKNGI